MTRPFLPVPGVVSSLSTGFEPQMKPAYGRFNRMQSVRRRHPTTARRRAAVGHFQTSGITT
ncbi:hypothetical protein D7207_08950 [Burkholderia cepacia]|nr:hypothetical protein [Burkholderia cepacia]MBA9945557.1 hypothetical protein [Burkholderia cepacia]MBA9973045.1 hypothetical protein [Burkholderia cepacia]MBA9991618.1 hypothetical protein [Burkholderia cepacia]MBB0000519.1 hypothetical protein [Burkholderia cepacia]